MRVWVPTFFHVVECVGSTSTDTPVGVLFHQLLIDLGLFGITLFQEERLRNEHDFFVILDIFGCDYATHAIIKDMNITFANLAPKSMDVFFQICDSVKVSGPDRTGITLSHELGKRRSCYIEARLSCAVGSSIHG